MSPTPRRNRSSAATKAAATRRSNRTTATIGGGGTSPQQYTGGNLVDAALHNIEGQVMLARGIGASKQAVQALVNKAFSATAPWPSPSTTTTSGLTTAAPGEPQS